MTPQWGCLSIRLILASEGMGILHTRLLLLGHHVATVTNYKIQSSSANHCLVEQILKLGLLLETFSCLFTLVLGNERGIEHVRVHVLYSCCYYLPSIALQLTIVMPPRISSTGKCYQGMCRPKTRVWKKYYDALHVMLKSQSRKHCLDAENRFRDW